MFQLEQAISAFVQKGHRILVCGRQHMRSWKAYKDNRNAHTSWFFTQNVLVLHLCVLFSVSHFLCRRKQKCLYDAGYLLNIIG